MLRSTRRPSWQRRTFSVAEQWLRDIHSHAPRRVCTASEPSYLVGMLSCMMRSRISLWSQAMARAIGEQSHRAAAGTVPSWSRHRPAHLVYNGKARYTFASHTRGRLLGPGTQSSRVEARPWLARCLVTPNQSGGLHHSRAGSALRGPRKPPEASVRLSRVQSSAAQQCGSGLGGLLFPALPIGRAQP